MPRRNEIAKNANAKYPELHKNHHHCRPNNYTIIPSNANNLLNENREKIKGLYTHNFSPIAKKPRKSIPRYHRKYLSNRNSTNHL